MKFTNSLLQLFILVSMVFSSSVNINTATSVANYHITVMDKSLTHSLNSIEAVTDANNVTIGFIAHLSPEGFIGIASDTDIRPITAFSFNSNILVDNDPYNSLYVTFFGDLEFKYNSISSLPQPYKSGSNTLWQKYSTQDPGIVRDGDTQQWPPDGSTSTGGWIEEAWHQNGVNNEYNGMCPIDPVTQERSDTGCGATAIAQILNYHCFIGDKVWTANDGYTSSESGVITIFDDWQLYDFPGIYGTEPNINTLLSSLNVNRYSLGIPLSDTQQNDYDYIRALNFIAGIAVEMQYSSNGSNSSPSGNEFIDDFQYTRADYMDYVSPTFLYALSENMKYAQPALLGSTGGAHSFVCDGYLNDDDNNDFFHLNFGWGDTGPYAIQDMWLDLAEDPFIILDPYEYSLAYGVLNIIPPNQTASISGNVSITSGTGDLSEVEITVGMYSTRPDTNGDYLLVLTDGSYELKCRLIGYNEIVNSITISAGSTNQIDFSLLPATQNTIHVDDDGTADYSTVQGGIDNASDHDIIIIHPGTYLENVILEGKNLIITSQFEIENDPTFIETTIIDGNNFGNTISITPGNYSKIQGFTITGSDQSDYGGGISCLGANIVLDNLIIEANETIRGGGIFISSASPVIKNSRITNNEIQQQGAALSCEYSNPVLDRLLIYGNSSGGIRFHGMNNTNLITNLTIASNQGTGLIVYNSNIEMVNSIIWDNNSQIYESTYSSAEISNSTIEGGWPGNENIPFNPQFVNPSTGDLSLSVSQYSPAIERGIHSEGVRYTGIYSDHGAVESDIVFGDLDEMNCVNVVDIVILVDIILNRITPTQFQLWVGDVNHDDYHTTQDINIISDVILSSTAHCGLLYRNISMDSTILKFNQSGGILSRNGEESIVLSVNSESEIRAIHSGFSVEDHLITEVEVHDDLEGFMVDFMISESSIEFILYSPDGASIQPGDQEILILNLSPLTSRVDGGLIIFDFMGEIVDNEYELFSINYEQLDDVLTEDIYPDSFKLHRPYPNPFNPNVTIRYSIPISSIVNLSIYDLEGRMVETLVNDECSPGDYDIVWNGSSHSSGIYFVKFQSNGSSFAQKIIMCK